MENIKFIEINEKYIDSFWESFNTIASERKYLAVISAFPLESTVEFLKTSKINKVPYLFVLDTKKDIVVGWCDAQPKNNKVGYLGMGLLKEYREKGIGKKLIQEVLRISKAFGHTSVELEVRNTNTRAINLYKSVGFYEIAIIKDGLKLDNMVEDVIQMKIDLNSLK